MKPILIAIIISLFSINGNACVDAFGNALQTDISDSYNNYQNKTNNLLDIAKQRFENLSKCRQEMRSAYDRFLEEQTKVRKEQRMLSIKIRRAELNRRKQLREFRQSCRADAEAKYPDLKNSLYNGGVINDPTQAASFEERVQNERTRLYNQCRLQAENVDIVKEINDELAINIDEINASMQDAVDALNTTQKSVDQLQRDIVQRCEEQKQFIEYSEKLAAQQAAQADATTSEKTAVSKMGALVSCLTGGIRGPAGLGGSGSIGDDTRLNSSH